MQADAQLKGQEISQAKVEAANSAKMAAQSAGKWGSHAWPHPLPQKRRKGSGDRDFPITDQFWH